MENKMTPSASEDGTDDEPLSSMDVVRYALMRDNRQPTFLKNVGIHPSHSRWTMSQLEKQLEAERAGHEKLRGTIDELQMAQETCQAERLKYVEDLQEMRKKQEEM